MISSRRWMGSPRSFLTAEQGVLVDEFKLEEKHWGYVPRDCDQSAMVLDVEHEMNPSWKCFAEC